MLLKSARFLIKSRFSFKQFYSVCKSVEMSGEVVGVSLKTVVSALDHFAPKELSEDWDNTGLLLEPYSHKTVTKILLTNDLTEDVAIEANSLDCEMIISYHPPIFAPMKSVTQSTWKERLVSILLEKRIALYSPHTRWDSVAGGVNEWLSSCFCVDSSLPIKEGTSPNVGAGRFLQLKQSISLDDCVKKIKILTGLNHVRIAIGQGKTIESTIETIALCAGSGASVLKGVTADLYLTGEMLHHDVLDATQKKISVILTNHSDSERGFLKLFSPILKEKLDNRVQVFVSKCDRDPIITV